MNRIVATVLVALGGALLFAASPVSAESRSAAIASFGYAPGDVQIAPGDTVVWTNFDPTVHTVTANRNEFSSGPMRQGQSFKATFNVPGVYPYFCEPHEFMRGTVSVAGGGTAVTTPSPEATTTTMVVAAPGASSTGGTAPTTVAGATVTTVAANAATTAAPVITPSGPIAVVGGNVTGAAEQPSPWAPVTVVLVLTGVGVVVLWRRGVALRTALRYGAIAGTAITGLLHLQLRLELAYPEPIGTLLVIEGAIAAVLTAWLVTRPWTKATRVATIAAHIAALGAIAITRTDIGLFGFHELGWDPSPQLPIAVAVGVLAIAFSVAAKTPAER